MPRDRFAGELIVEQRELATPELEAIPAGTTTDFNQEAHMVV
jgi:hypothetical protein